jgi:hypothetical protein
MCFSNSSVINLDLFWKQVFSYAYLIFLFNKKILHDIKKLLLDFRSICV